MFMIFQDLEILKEYLILLSDRILDVKFDLIIMVINSQEFRIDNLDNIIAKGLDFFVNNVNSENVLCVFTRCDLEDLKDEETESYLSNLTKKSKLSFNLNKSFKYGKKNVNRELLLKEIVKLKNIPLIEMKKKIDINSFFEFCQREIDPQGKACFSINSLVYKKKSSDEFTLVKIDSLELNDYVMVSDFMNKGISEKIISITHHNNDLKEILSFYLENNHEFYTLDVSRNHKLLIYEELDNKIIEILAEDVKIGDKFILKNGKKAIIKKISLKFSNVINVRTPSCRIIVNEILCSCGTQGDGGKIGQFFLGKIASLFGSKISNYVNKIGRKLENK